MNQSHVNKFNISLIFLLLLVLLPGWRGVVTAQEPDLFGALEAEDFASIKTMLDQGANVNKPHAHGWTPLILAASKNNTAIMKLLLEKGADVKASVNVEKPDGPAKGMTALMYVARLGNIDMVRTLLERGAAPDAKEKHGASALWFASDGGHFEIVKILLHLNVDPNVSVSSGQTPLLFAAKRLNEETARLLLERGAQPNVSLKYQVGWESDVGSTPLMYFAKSGNAALVRMLIEKGAEIDRKDFSKRRALDYAVQGRTVEVVRVLLDKGAQLEMLDGYGRTALLNAVIVGSKDIVELLINRKAALNVVSAADSPVDDSDQNSWGLTPLMLAIQRSNQEIVTLLLEHGADVNASARDEPPAKGTSALTLAVHQNNPEIIRWLLDRKANVNSQDDKGLSPLIAAAFSERPEVIKLLIAHGAEVNHKDKSGSTALMIAVDFNRPKNVTALIESSANVNERNQRGKSAVMIAAAKEGDQENSAILTALVEAKADSSIFDDKGLNALMYAAQEGNEEAVKLLIERGENVNAKNNKGITPLMFAVASAGNTFNYIVETLIAKGADVNAQDAAGNTPLMVAAWFGRDTTAKVLMMRGAISQARNTHGEDALLLAARAGVATPPDMFSGFGTYVRPAPEAEYVALVNHLLNRGVAINSRNKQGETALMLASHNGKLEMCKLLLSRGAALRIKDASKKTARLHAEQKYQEQIVALLKAAETGDWRKMGVPVRDMRADGPKPTRPPVAVSGERPSSRRGDAEPSPAFWQQFTVVFENDRPVVVWPQTSRAQGRMMQNLFADLTADGFGGPGTPRQLKAFWDQLEPNRRATFRRKYAGLFASQVDSVVPDGVAKLFGPAEVARIRQTFEMDDKTIAMVDEEISKAAPKVFTTLKELGIGMDADTVNREFGDLLKGPTVRSLRALLSQGQSSEAWNAIETARSAPFRVLQQQRDVIIGSGPKKLREELSNLNLEILHAQQEAIRLANEFRAAGGDLRDVFPEDSEGPERVYPEPVRAAQTRESRRLEAAGARIQDLFFRRVGLVAELVDEWEAETPTLTAAETAKLLPEGSVSVVFAYEFNSLDLSSTRVNRIYVLALQGGAKVEGEDSEAVLSPPILTHTIELSAAELSQEMNSFRAAITHSDTPVARIAAQGRKLFDKLFPGELGRAVRGARQLLISPDGPLWDMPFTALVTNADGAPAYLGLEKRLSFTASLTQLAYAKNRQASLNNEQKPFAVVLGEPNFNRRAWLPAEAFLVRSYLDPLPATRPEAECIAKLYGAKPPATKQNNEGVLLLGNEATEASLRRWVEKADIIHLATHGYIETARQLTMNSGVWLTPSPQRPTRAYSANDGALQAAEVFNQLKLKADLVIISACEMGRGRDLRGAGVADMIWALHAAGANSVVASQWEVADKSTSTLMVAFHEFLCQGLSKDESLRRAMLKLHAEAKTSHPYFWAPFVLSGDSQNNLPIRTQCHCSVP